MSDMEKCLDEARKKIMSDKETRLNEAKAFIKKKQYDKAFPLLKAFGDTGAGEVRELLYDCYIYGRVDIKEQLTEAEKWTSCRRYDLVKLLVQNLAKEGNAEAQYMLGECYDYGKKKTKAVKWYTKAAAQGYDEAQYFLGNCFNEGKGVFKNTAKAIEWWSKAAAQGYHIAQSSIEHAQEIAIEAAQNNMKKRFTKAFNKANALYDSGQYDKAVPLLQTLAEEGYADAQFLLGDCCSLGKGVEKDYTKAVEWWTKSAEQGNDEAQYLLGISFERGKGVTQNDDKAVEWYTKASQKGNSNAQRELCRRDLGHDWVYQEPRSGDGKTDPAYYELYMCRYCYKERKDEITKKDFARYWDNYGQ